LQWRLDIALESTSRYEPKYSGSEPFFGGRRA
jgi:hypothetical protein